MPEEEQSYEEYGEVWHDWELAAAIKYNGGIAFAEIVQVLAMHEGERDVAPWCWLIQTRHGYVWAEGECDYTGWH
jgi:hypothetical protein